MRRSRLKIQSFIYGLRRDSALDEERLLSARTLTNYAIDYSDGRLKVRKGYSRWNSTILAATATQLFWFADLNGNEHLLGILDGDLTSGLWYDILESGAHVKFDTQIATARQPIVQVKNRVFYGTDSGGATASLMWADDASLGTGDSYRVGIIRPSQPLGVTTGASAGHTPVPDPGVKIVLNPTTQRKWGIPFTISTKTVMAGVTVSMQRFEDRTDLSGSVKVQIETDNGGEPSGTIVDSDATGPWLGVEKVKFNSFADEIFPFYNRIELEPADYWIVLEGDTAYYNHYLNASLVTDFHVGLGVEDSPGAFTYGKVQVYDNGTDTWSEDDAEAVFSLNTLTASVIYDYVHTYFNSTYGSESRPSDAARVEATTSAPATTISPIGTLDGQVDKYKLYRRTVPLIDSPEDDITDAYDLVAEVAIDQAIVDSLEDGFLGAELQTQDHYTYDETDDTGGTIRTAALVPAISVLWKGRVFFVEADDNILHFSKKLEEDGATGLTGDSIYDYFPLENRLEVNYPSDIIALVPLSADDLAIYFKNTSVWVLRGTDDVLNPPADMVLRQIATDVGLIAPAAVDSLRGRHVFLSRKGLYDFRGIPGQEYLSAGIQTILDDIGDSYLDDSIIVAQGDSIWLAVDENEDGFLENVYILDIQRRIPTWRLYNYGVNINDMVVRNTGSEYRTLLAADADNNYILQLEDGNTDNGSAIVSELETQDLIAPNLATIFEISIDAYYPNVPPVYEIEITDALGEVHRFEMAPLSTDDIAGHKAYPIVTSAVGARVKIIQRTVNQNHLRSIDVGIVER